MPQPKENSTPPPSQTHTAPQRTRQDLQLIYMGGWAATVQNKHREVWINYVVKDVFTLRVSSLNYALRCSAVSVSGLIWMFEKIIEGWEKPSQRSSSASLRSSQKTTFLPRIHHKAFCMTSDLVCSECSLESILEALVELLRAHIHTHSLLQADQAFQAATCECLHCRDLWCAFICPPQSERTETSPNGKIQAEAWTEA